jgi:hypothetical protein
MVMRHQWHAPALPVEPLVERLAKIAPDLPDIESWLAPLRAGQPIAVTRETANATVRTILEAERLWSILLIPIVIDGTCWGQIELDDATPGRQWKPEEIDLLVSLGSLIGTAIAREHRLEALADADTIIRNSPTILYRQGGEPSHPLKYISPNIAKYGIDPAALLNSPNSYLSHIHPDDRPKAAASLAHILDTDADRRWNLLVDGKPQHACSRPLRTSARGRGHRHRHHRTQGRRGRAQARARAAAGDSPCAAAA